MKSKPSSAQAYARVAGWSYLIIAVLGIFSFFFVITSLVVPGDAAATAANLRASAELFRLGIAAFLIVLLFDIVVGWAFYVLLRPVDKFVSLLAAFLRLTYSIVHAAALIFLVLAAQLLATPDYLTGFDSTQADTLVLLFLDGHDYGFLLALLFFGFHLCVLGYLIFKSGYIPKILGVLLIVAGVGYAVDTFANVLLPNYDDYATIFLVIAAVPSIIGELAITFWLLIKGIDVERWEQRVLAYAESRAGGLETRPGKSAPQRVAAEEQIGGTA